MIKICPEYIARLDRLLARIIFCRLWEDRVAQKSNWVVVDHEAISELGFYRQSIHQSLKWLESNGYIRRKSDSNSWGVVMVNPLVLEPSNMGRKELGDEAMRFNPLPTLGPQWRKK